MLEAIDAVDCKRFTAFLQSPSLPSYKISIASGEIVILSESVILCKYFSISFFSNSLNLKIAQRD